METRSRDNQQIFSEAAEWLVEFREESVDPQLRAQFNRWVRQSPEHIRAYLEVAAFWADVPRLVAKDDVDVEALIAYGRGDDNVVPLPRLAISPQLPPKEPLSAPFTPKPTPRQRRIGLLAAGIAMLGLATGALIHFRMQSGVYATEVGEQRSFNLEDGSNVELNARSRIRVRFTAQARTIDLLEGQALFHVAPDPSRPFSVTSGNTWIRAVGTQFDVYRKEDGTTVSVVEGRVAVLLNQPVARQQSAERNATTATGSEAPKPNDGDADTKLLLSAGEQIIVTAQAAVRPKQADVSTLTAWTQRQIVFHASSLSEVCEQFNRYNRKQLVIDDPELRDVRVSGVFSTTDPTSLLRFLHERVRLVMTEKDGRIVISRK